MINFNKCGISENLLSQLIIKTEDNLFNYVKIFYWVILIEIYFLLKNAGFDVKSKSVTRELPVFAQVFLSLFKMHLQVNDSASDTNVKNALQVLYKHADKIDALQVSEYGDMLTVSVANTL